MECLCRLTTNTHMVTRIVVQNCERQVFMPLPGKLPNANSRFALSDTCVRCSFPDVCGCLVVVRFSVIPGFFLNFRNDRGREHSSFVSIHCNW